MLTCPFCGTPETDRIDLDGARFVVFGCMFTPRLDPALGEEAAQQALRSTYGERGSAYFRGMCDALHLYVTKGGGRLATAGPD